MMPDSQISCWQPYAVIFGGVSGSRICKFHTNPLPAVSFSFPVLTQRSICIRGNVLLLLSSLLLLHVSRLLPRSRHAPV